MDTNNFDNFNETSTECDAFESDICLRNLKRYRPTPKRLLPPLQPIDFAKYLKENCQQKVNILQRDTFHQIKKPIVIFFNHFREKCSYHTKCLDKLFQLALKYGERIEFIAGDILDINILSPKWHSIDLFCRIGNPEKASALIYAIDEQKRIHEHPNAEKDYESLITLCENLLKGNLFITQPPTAPNDHSLVKICVHQNYRQLVTNSSKNILLLIDLQDINERNKDIELIAEQLQSYNVQLVYINAEKNYIPFELGISSYPSLVLLPHDDKTNSIEPLIGPFSPENIINCVKSYFKDPKAFLERKQLELRKSNYQPLNILDDFKLDFQNLQQYLENNCHQYLKVFEREAFKFNRFVIIAFMDFENGQCLTHHFQWIDKIYQVAINLSSPREYFIADYKDIDVINPAWQPIDFRKHTRNGLLTTPKVFGIDLNKNKFVLKDFRNAASLFYFAHSLTNGELYISEPWPNMNEDKLVKTCIADGLNLSITSTKSDIFLAIYFSNNENYQEFLQTLEEVAREFEAFPLKVMKIDSRLNCISLDLDTSMYPIMYFIPEIDKNKRIPFSSDNFCKKDIVDFIKQNIKRENQKSS